jgi:hypothetical protein
MAEVLQAWLADAGVEASNLEQVTSWASQPCQTPTHILLMYSARRIVQPVKYHLVHSALLGSLRHTHDAGMLCITSCRTLRLAGCLGSFLQPSTYSQITASL